MVPPSKESPFVPIENLDPSIPLFHEHGDIASAKYGKSESKLQYLSLDLYLYGIGEYSPQGWE